jgi:hypothetical protein
MATATAGSIESWVLMAISLIYPPLTARADQITTTGSDLRAPQGQQKCCPISLVVPVWRALIGQALLSDQRVLPDWRNAVRYRKLGSDRST